MPVYESVCRDCKKPFEVVRPISDATTTPTYPACGSTRVDCTYSHVYAVTSKKSWEGGMSIPRSVEKFLGDQHVAYSVLPHRPAYTAQEEAAAAHVPGRQWAKTVACMADERPILAVVPAPSLVDLDHLRDIAGAREIRLASERECERFYPDCELGAMPPLGPLYGQPVFVDRTLATGGGEVVFDAGSHSDAVKVRYDDFARVVRPIVSDIGRARGVPLTH